GEELARLAPARAVEVVNGGVPGYSIYQSALLFERRIRPLAPDVLVLYLGAWNDYNPAMDGSDRELGRRDGARSSGLQRLHELLAHSRIYQVLGSHYASALRFRDWRATIVEWLAGEPSGGYRVAPVEFREHLERILDECRADGACVLVLLPCLNDG